jgi:hypothetical protein
MQYQADLLGCPVMRSDVPELSAMGAALLARKALLQIDTEQLRQYLPEHATFTPDEQRHGRLQKRWHDWQSAVQLARTQKTQAKEFGCVRIPPDKMICGDCSPQFRLATSSVVRETRLKSKHQAIFFASFDQGSAHNPHVLRVRSVVALSVSKLAAAKRLMFRFRTFKKWSDPSTEALHHDRHQGVLR